MSESRIRDASTGETLLLRLEQSADQPVARVGAKARNLGVLRRAGLPVPEGYVLTAEAWKAFAAHAELPADPAEARARCATAPIPGVLSAEIDRVIEDLPGPLAVRSAAIAEDGNEASAAGQFQSVLGVEGRGAVLTAVRDCWASLFDDAATAYQRDRGVEPGAMAVILQRMVTPRAAGVLFTRTAGGGGLVEAVAGPGQLLVDGTVNPVRYRLPQPADPQDPLLPSAVLASLARLGEQAEVALGETERGVDVEWAWSGNELVLLQARPITREVDATDRVRWIAANTQEALLDPVTPLTWSLLAPLVEAGRRDLFSAAGFEEIPGPSYMRLWYGLPYFNPGYFQRFLQQIPGAPESIFDALIFGEGRGIEFRLPEFNSRTARLIGLFLLARLAARERFEVYQRVYAVKLSRLRARSLPGLTDAELLGLRREATDLLDGALRRHVLGTAISGGAYILLDLFLEHTGATRELRGGLTSRLTAGAPGNALACAGRELEGIARQIAASGADAARLLADLPAAEGPLAREFRAFLRRHGHRCEKEAELSEPRWSDDPQVLLDILAGYVRAERAGGTGADGRAEALGARARSLALRVSAHLAKSSWLERVIPARRLVFRYLLREARRYAPYRENLKDCALRSLHLLRGVFLELGERLTRRGVLARAEDVFFLDTGEAERGLLAPSLRAARALGLDELVSERRAERERNLALDPPPLVVEVPGRPPQPVHPGRDPRGLIEGVGVSSGQVVGVARVLDGMHEATRLAPGEILVARVINAGWTPLFHLASAIVAEVGGVLSHGAIVAREYGIPAVFGAAGATGIQDGQRIRVDGDLGLITIL